MHALPNHAQTLLHNLLEGASDGHDLADGLHAGADATTDASKLRQVPTGDLSDEVIHLRSDGGRARCARFADLVERVANRQLGRDEGQWIAARLGGQRGGAAQSGVNFDDAVVARLRVVSILDVALADNAQVTHSAHRELLQLGDLILTQRAGRRHDDALARMHAERINILHADHRKAAVGAIADHLKLNLLPALQRLLYEDLRGEGKGTLSQSAQLALCLADATPLPTQCVS